MKIKALMFYFLAFGLGCVTGYQIHNKRIDYKINYLYGMYNLVKKKNNDFLTNFMTIYSKQSGLEGKYTDMDEYIRAMWMD